MKRPGCCPDTRPQQPLRLSRFQRICCAGTFRSPLVAARRPCCCALSSPAPRRQSGRPLPEAASRCPREFWPPRGTCVRHEEEPEGTTKRLIVRLLRFESDPSPVAGQAPENGPVSSAPQPYMRFRGSAPDSPATPYLRQTGAATPDGLRSHCAYRLRPGSPAVCSYRIRHDPVRSAPAMATRAAGGADIVMA
jgi:hypothetical protein